MRALRGAQYGQAPDREFGVVPMAEGARSPIWPLPAVTRRRWTFGADRAGGTRHHAGIDLYAPRGSEVLAPESGTLIASQRFNGPHAVALLLQTDTGPVILLGEVEPGSWQSLGLSVGSRVNAGQPIATVGINPGGSQMLHLEMYADGTTRNHRWMAGDAPPPQLLNPTQYLQTAKALDVDQQDPQIPDDDGQVEDPDHEDPDDAQGDEDDPDILPDVVPPDPGLPQSNLPTVGLVALGVFLLLEGEL